MPGKMLVIFFSVEKLGMGMSGVISFSLEKFGSVMSGVNFLTVAHEAIVPSARVNGIQKMRI
jgi:hypothetical protein